MVFFSAVTPKRLGGECSVKSAYSAVQNLHTTNYSSIMVAYWRGHASETPSHHWATAVVRTGQPHLYRVRQMQVCLPPCQVSAKDPIPALNTCVGRHEPSRFCTFHRFATQKIMTLTDFLWLAMEIWNIQYLLIQYANLHDICDMRESEQILWFAWEHCRHSSHGWVWGKFLASSQNNSGSVVLTHCNSGWVRCTPTCPEKSRRGFCSST